MVGIIGWFLLSWAGSCCLKELSHLDEKETYMCFNMEGSWIVSRKQNNNPLGDWRNWGLSKDRFSRSLGELHILAGRRYFNPWEGPENILWALDWQAIPVYKDFISHCLFQQRLCFWFPVYTARQVVTSAFCWIRTRLKPDANFLMFPFHLLTLAIYMQMYVFSLGSL